MLPAMLPSARPNRVMIVEDDPLVRTLVADELRQAGYRVVEAASADEALDYVAAGGDLDLVLSDVGMPGTMDGVGLARRLGRDRPSLPVVLASGRALPREAGGVAGFLRKPYKLGDVIRVVSGVLGAGRTDG